jgi:hypothetical protein
LTEYRINGSLGGISIIILIFIWLCVAVFLLIEFAKAQSTIRPPVISQAAEKMTEKSPASYLPKCRATFVTESASARRS